MVPVELLPDAGMVDWVLDWLVVVLVPDPVPVPVPLPVLEPVDGVDMGEVEGEAEGVVEGEAVPGPGLVLLPDDELCANVTALASASATPQAVEVAIR